MKLGTLAALVKLSMPLTAGVFSVAALNFAVHHNRYEAHQFEKIDGIASFTRVTVESYTEVDMISPLGNVIYLDTNNDGLVDKVYEYPFYVQSTDAWALFTKAYSREKDFYDYKTVFLTADKKYRDQLKRFNINLKPSTYYLKKKNLKKKKNKFTSSVNQAIRPMEVPYR